MNREEFDNKLRRLDVVLFSAIPSQTTDADRQSLLAVQNCTRDQGDSYVYLEIGSHLGGSIQPHLLDPKCAKIYSIDKRPAAQPDERGQMYPYPDNSTNRMLANLGAIDELGVKKIECIDESTCRIPPSLIQLAPSLCFIDGEHTRNAVIADFDFCVKVCAPGATIVFHDAQTVFRALRSIVKSLKRTQREFSVHAFLDMVYVVCLDKSDVHGRLAEFSACARRDDLWSRRNDLRLLKWRAASIKQRALGIARGLRRSG